MHAEEELLREGIHKERRAEGCRDGVEMVLRGYLLS